MKWLIAVLLLALAGGAVSVWLGQHEAGGLFGLLAAGALGGTAKLKRVGQKAAKEKRREMDAQSDATVAADSPVAGEHDAHGQTVTPIPSEPLMVPLELCESEIDKLADESEAELSRQSAAFVITLNETAATMQTTCDAAVVAAVATERRNSEPRQAAADAIAAAAQRGRQSVATRSCWSIAVAVRREASWSAC